MVEAYQNGEGSFRAIAKRFSVSLNFVWLLWQRYQQTGLLEPKPQGGGHTSVIEGKYLSLLAKLVEQHNDAPLKQLADPFNDKTGFQVSTLAISRALKKLNITRKKKTFHAIERDRDATIEEEREAFIAERPTREVEKLIFIDESGIQLGMTPDDARAPAGQRAPGAKPTPRGQNILLIGALSQPGVTHAFFIPGAINGDVFKYFIEQYLVSTLKPGDIVLMDNLPVHQVAGIEKLITGAGATLKFLPRYSPELSPIELCWSKVKSILRRLSAQNVKSLLAAVKNALNAVTENDAQGWFDHRGYCIEAEWPPQ